jgi:hypothetical protein
VRGGTALLDAVGMTLSSVREHAAHRYIAIVHTDGEENASREWTAAAVRELIARLEEKGNWTFAFFGEGIDAWQQAEGFGFSGGRARQHTARDFEPLYVAESRVSNVMRKRKMASTMNFASASAAVMTDAALTDDEIASMLTQQDDDSAEKPVDAPKRRATQRKRAS